MNLSKPALLLLLLSPLALAGAVLARQAAQDITGPLAIAANAAQVAVAAPGKLYLLDTAGRLQAVHENLVATDARDAGLAWLGSTLLLSPAAEGRALLRCRGESCEPFSSDPYAPIGPVQVASAMASNLWLIETEADRVHRYTESGQRIDMPLSNLQQPGAAWQSGMSLYVANTGSGKLQRYTLHKRGVGGSAEDIAVFQAPPEARDPPVRPLRLLPLPDGSFRLLLTNDSRTRGALARVSADGRQQVEDIPALVNPVSFTALGRDLLVVDEDRMQVLRIKPDGTATVFGDADFNNALAAQQGQRTLLRALLPALLLVATLLAALGGWLLLRKLLHGMTEPALPPRPDADNILWLPADNALLPRRLLLALVPALPPALCPALLAAHFHHPGAGQLWLVAVLLLAATPTLLNAMRARVPDKLRIGLRERHLVIEHAQHGRREYPLALIPWNETALQPEAEVMLPLQRDGIALFHRPTLRTLLFPKLAAGRKT